MAEQAEWTEGQGGYPEESPAAVQPDQETTTSEGAARDGARERVKEVGQGREDSGTMTGNPTAAGGD